MSQTPEIDKLTFYDDATGASVTANIKDTTYSVAEKGAAGLCPALPNEETTSKYLRQDGTWQVPDSNYPLVSTAELNQICV